MKISLHYRFGQRKIVGMVISDVIYMEMEIIFSIALNVVDFPAPFCPIKPVIQPLGILRFKSLMEKFLNSFDRELISIAFFSLKFNDIKSSNNKSVKLNK